MKHMALLAALFLCFIGPGKQQNSQEPDLSARKIAAVTVGYSKENRVGQIFLSNSEGKFEQYFDIWGKSSNDFSPVVITYVFEKRDPRGRRFYTATWGKGPVHRNAFHASCLSDVPEFKDDVYWTAKILEGRVEFQALEDGVLKEAAVKVLFRSVKGTLQRFMFEHARPAMSQAPYDDQRILVDLADREENRKTWYAQGWLRPENRCVKYFQ